MKCKIGENASSVSYRRKRQLDIYSMKNLTSA